MQKAEVVVIGGGVIGTSITYYLSKLGKSVALIEKDDFASGSSGACGGTLMLQSKRPGIHLTLAMKSLKEFDNLVKELDYDIEYQKGGGMIVAETDEQMEAMAKFVKDQKEAGLDVRLLTTDEARRLEPALSEQIAGATFSPMDAKVNPLYLTFSFAEAAQKYGAKLCTSTEVRSILTKNNRVVSVTTDRSKISTSTVVNAAGVLAPMIGEMVNLNIPITPRRGQVVVTEPVPPLVKHVMLDAQYMAAKLGLEISREPQDESIRLGVGLVLEQTVSGNLLVGSTREFVGYDRNTTIEGIKAIVRHASRIVPALNDIHMIRTFAGLRPYTSDGLPILGTVDDIEGFIMAAGHEGDGIALAPITGRLIAELIANGKPSMSLEPFNLSRFS